MSLPLLIGTPQPPSVNFSQKAAHGTSSQSPGIQKVDPPSGLEGSQKQNPPTSGFEDSGVDYRALRWIYCFVPEFYKYISREVQNPRPASSAPGTLEKPTAPVLRGVHNSVTTGLEGFRIIGLLLENLLQIAKKKDRYLLLLFPEVFVT